MAQSVISAYESGHREPALSTLRKLVAATGHRLVIEIESLPGAGLGLPDTPLGRRLRQRRPAVLEVVKRYGGSNVRVFGSVARGESNDDSDIDLLVDLAPDTGLLGLAALERELAKLLSRPVDVVPADSMKPRVYAAAEADAVTL